MAQKAFKGNHLRELLLKDGSCEEKLEKIHEYMGIPYQPTTSNVEQGVDNEATPNEAALKEIDSNETNETNEAENVQSARDISITKIVSGLQGVELRLANLLLTAIEQSSILSWDTESLELKIRGENVAHSNITSLIQKTVRLKHPTLPYGLALFIFHLLEIKCPIRFIKDADCLNIRKNLILIKENIAANESVAHEGSEAEAATAESEIEAQNTGNVIEVQNEPSRGDVENIIEPAVETKQSKRKRKSELETENIGSIESDGNEQNLRRSKRLRLKPGIEYGWNSLSKTSRS